MFYSPDETLPEEDPGTTSAGDSGRQDELCSGPGRNGESRCDNRVRVLATGLCMGHHTQMKRHGELKPLHNHSNKGVKCIGPGHDGNPCGLQVHSRQTGLCSSHDTQQRNGSELTSLQKRAAPTSDILCSGPGVRGSGCDRLASFKRTGLCWSHNKQQKAGEAFRPLKPYRHSDDPRGECAYAGCTQDLYCQGLCTGHYNQMSARRPIGPLVSLSWSKVPATDRDKMGNKYCPGCDQWCDLGEFSINRFRVDGLSEFCRTCRGLNRVRVFYGLDASDYTALLARQGGGCAICGRVTSRENGKSLAVDHDHSCCPGSKTCGDCVRGLLCDNCNVGLGCFGDDFERLRRAAAYVVAGGGLPPALR